MKLLIVFSVHLLFSGCLGDESSPNDPGVMQGSAETETPVQEQVSAKEATELLNSTCAVAGCHSGFLPSAGLNLEAHQVISNTVEVPASQLKDMNLIQPANPDSSYLIHKIQGSHLEQGGSGRQMPIGNILSEEHTTALITWVSNLRSPADGTSDSTTLPTDPVNCITTNATEITGNTVDENCDGVISDVDGDGFESTSNGGTDCNDNNAAVKPGATEIIDDNVDQDCDGIQGWGFTKIHTDILSGQCSCHSSSHPTGLIMGARNIAFLNLVNVMAANSNSALDRVKPGSADNSFIIRKLEGSLSAGEGSRMPASGGFLNQSTIDELKSWINLGAADN